MTYERPTLNSEDHLQQFHNVDHYDIDNDIELPYWWELPAAPQHYAEGGSVIQQIKKAATDRQLQEATTHSHTTKKHDKLPIKANNEASNALVDHALKIMTTGRRS